MELNGESSVHSSTSRVVTEEVRRTQQEINLPVEPLRYLLLSALLINDKEMIALRTERDILLSIRHLLQVCSP